MDDAAYAQYQHESADWLRKGRSALVRGLIERHHDRERRSLELLEVGAGVGQNLPMLASFGRVDASEINPVGVEAIRHGAVAREIFTAPIPFTLGRTYDVICALDVIEHLEDDRGGVACLAQHLRPGGLLVATVPAYQFLFSDHDRALHHFRRYTRRSFCDVFPSDLTIVTAGYFNHLLFPAAVAARGAWSLKRMFAGGGAQKQSSPSSPAATRVLGAVMQTELALIERGYTPAWGLSVYCVARKR
ncbi:MAG: class I SAM-dependent methyltransferase [Polyangiaceae bacterium]|nr:class I SAM-dependent methyltransferase [Polyangiaceae bacterium]